MMTSYTVMKTARVLLLSLFLAKDIVGASKSDPEIEFFTCQKLDASLGKWRPDTSFHEGQKGKMTCVVRGNEDECRKCFISKTYGENLSTLESSVLTYEFDTECSMIGTYQCTCQNRSKIAKLGVLACQPRFCKDDDELEISEYVDVHRTMSISRCIVAYKGIMETAYLNGEQVIANTLPEGKRWSWWYEKGQFSKYTVHIQLRNVSDQDYRDHNFTVFSNEGEQYKMDLKIVLKKPVLPECPKQVRVTEIGTKNVSLKWTPVSNVSPEQAFHVLRSKDSVTWKMALRVEEARATIYNLNESTDYFFRVVSSNMFGEATGCEEVKTTTTGSLSSGEESVVQRLSFARIMAIAGFWLSSLSLMFGFDVKQCFETREMQKSRLNVGLTDYAESASQSPALRPRSWEAETEKSLANGALANPTLAWEKSLPLLD